MMNLATLAIQIVFIAFLAWGGVLSLQCIARDETSDSGAGA
jgi:hypothetical protein